MNVQWLANLKKHVTGTTVGSSDCLDVSPKNTAGTPLFVSQTSGVTVLETRFHDAATTQINNSGAAFVQVGGAAALANTIAKIHVNSTIGEPLVFRIGADAAAAALASNLFIINSGEGPSSFDVSLASGDKIWVKSLSTSDVTEGYLTLNFIG